MHPIYPDDDINGHHTSSSSASTSTGLHHESTTDSDGPRTPSDDDNEPDFPAQSIGVSISRQQTRLASAKTPAAEKAAAMEGRGGFFNNDKYHLQSYPSADQHVVSNEFGSPQKIRNISQGQDTKHPDGEGKSPLQISGKANTATSPRHELPSPWRTGPRFFERSGESSATLKEGFTIGRKRSSSGPDDSRMRFPTFNLPSIPNFFGSDGANDSEHIFAKDRDFQQRRLHQKPEDIPQSDGATWKKGSWVDLATRVRRSSHQLPKEDDSDASISPSEEELRRDSQRPSPLPIQPYPQPRHGIKRTKSDDSLLLHETLSRVSSLGDDSRFENVSEQINSRFKAFKDSMQDASFRVSLPRPASIFTASSSKIGPPRRGSSPRASAFNLRRSLFSGIDSPQQDLSCSESKRGLTFPLSQKRGSKSSTGMTMADEAAHPFLAQALEDLEGDIVILGGYRGSILREAHEPHRRLWVPIKVGLNIRKVDLEVGLDPEDEERMPEKIISTGMLTHIGPVDMSKRLFKRLRACENAQNGKLRIHDYGYDWRLSPHRLSRELGRFLETLPCNAPDVPLEKRGAIVVAHSLGGLITRHVMNRSPHLFAGVLFAGTPHEGCVNVLGPIRNGDDVLLSSKVLTAQVNFTIRTSFLLLPLDGRCFIDKDTKEELPCDFFDVQQWIKYRWSPCIAPPLPPLQTKNPSRVNSIINSMTNVVPDSVIGSIPFTNKRHSQQFRSGQDAKDAIKDHAASAAQTAQSAAHAEGGRSTGLTPQMGGNNPAEYNQSTQSSVATHCTIPHEKALEYLTRTLKETKTFKQELALTPSHASENRYPPMAIIYGKSDPTVYGARVHGRDGIERADAYDDLAFASGDGVVLARGAMLPPGFRAVRGGVVASERGHVTLLGDLEAVGRCLNALMAARKAGVGMGMGMEGVL
ncbi:hypothetical protein EG327_007305 [Venturia inaequalis]|uniref:Uncharacterized protein n=1 Tax=Venturia inaequalis TaxID=5025 RepID=A0A8H3YYM2_VENIN|nr:hypothetical protein EG327_007305 [Venturia inaequalis]